MHVRLIQTIFLVLLATSSGYGLFLNRTIPAVSRNITCIVDFQVFLHVGILNSSIFDFSTNDSSSSIADFCLIYYVNQTSLNGTQILFSLTTVMSGINPFQQLSRRCGPNFSPSNTPIGYGTCTPYPDSSTITTLCVCSTSYCNSDYVSCVRSVQATSSPPANLPTIIPELTNIITCQTGYQGATYSYQYNLTNIFQNDLVSTGVDASYNYSATHAVACIFMLNQDTGDWVRGGLVYESYPFDLLVILQSAIIFNLSSNLSGETTTSVSGPYPATYLFTTGRPFTGIECVCTTNNCNIDFTTCSTGTNYTYNTTSMASTNYTYNTTSMASISPTTSWGTSKMKKTDVLFYFISSICLIHSF